MPLHRNQSIQIKLKIKLKVNIRAVINLTLSDRQVLKSFETNDLTTYQRAKESQINLCG